MRYGHRLVAGVFVLFIGMALADTTSAHTRSQSFSSWRIQDGQVRLTFRIKSVEAIRLLRVEDEMSDLDALLLAHLASRIAVTSGGKACRDVAGLRALRAWEGYLRVGWRFACPLGVPIEITNDVFFEQASSHVHYARVRASHSPPVEYLFTDAERRHVIAADGQAQAEPQGTSFGAYVVLGIEHILVGLDHIAFLLALLLLCRRVREVVFIVTGFTLGHSITLSLDVLGIIEPNVPVIKALIGFTIALVAAENIGVTANASRAIAIIGGVALMALGLLRFVGEIGPPAVMLLGLALFTVCYLSLSNTQETAASLRPTLTVLFGLIHGCGFASVLIEIGLPTGRLASALFGFNLGVEIGQLGIVTALGIVGTLLAKRFASADYRLAIDTTSAALCGLGLFWFVQRLSLLAVNVAYAHDIWLHAERFTLDKGDTLIVHQLFGAKLETDLLRPGHTLELPVLRNITSRFALITAQDSVNLLGELPDIRTQPEVKPVLKRKLDFDGLALVTMKHDIIYAEFDNDVFFEYLQHEGLDHEKFKEHMGSRPAQSEGYVRILKSLVHVGKAMGTELRKQVLGQKIEILLLQNPYRLDPGDSLDVKVLFEGKPLRGQLVKVFNSDGKGPVSKQQARTNPDGIAQFTLDRGGLWLIRLVHLLPCSKRSNVDCKDADWESCWTFYSFELD